jgi:hypothetical protein
MRARRAGPSPSGVRVEQPSRRRPGAGEGAEAYRQREEEHERAHSDTRSQATDRRRGDTEREHFRRGVAQQQHQSGRRDGNGNARPESEWRRGRPQLAGHEHRPVQERPLVEPATACGVDEHGREEDHRGVEVEEGSDDGVQRRQGDQQRVRSERETLILNS